MKRLPDSELELMMIIWDAKAPITRTEIEDRLPPERRLSSTTVLSFLARLQEKGFVKVQKTGRNNIYEPLVSREEYLRTESKSIWKRLYQGSIKNFMTALSDGEGLSDRDLEELQEFLDQKKGGR
mgnify:CR=1 FL=1|jgi:Predicted transcriptional regulator